MKKATEYLKTGVRVLPKKNKNPLIIYPKNANQYVPKEAKPLAGLVFYTGTKKTE